MVYVDWKLPDWHNAPSTPLDKQPGIWFTWQWKLWGFGYATEDMGGYLLLKMPYWSIVLPLTLLSAYSLLSKPREPKSKVEPIGADGEPMREFFRDENRVWGCVTLVLACFCLGGWLRSLRGVAWTFELGIDTLPIYSVAATALTVISACFLLSKSDRPPPDPPEST